MEPEWLPSTVALLREWRDRARTNQKVHYDRAEQLQSWNRALGVPHILLAAAVGTSIFATLKQDIGVWPRVTVALISFLGAALGGLQTFFKFSEYAAQHHAVAAGYGIVFRAIEKALALPPHSREASQVVLGEIEAQLNQLPKQAPAIPRRIWKRVLPHLTPQAPKPQNGAA